ncbi:MAG: MBL fold metallo-hydrolase [Betaproteobacteria bacterium]|nr:MBL fold metallo-hydrolase [Betaproteobacteria bacterium]NBT10452.1 MBL fold metallo-hydrolase [Betaproteobacteria bacterium]NBU49152.1 MBL fold metallo-hydrolase [Betaproteobacteria bacterium]NBX97019.1 MBL fold metallo-hydrolase [Betaproteobacteria bacterium]
MSNPFKPQVQAFFDTPTWTVTYVVYDREGGCAAIIDSVLNYDHKSGRIGHTRADEVIAFIKANSLKVQWILETHAHADHLSAAPYLKQHLGGRIGIGAGIDSVQKVFKGLFNLEPEFKTDGSQFDRLFQDEEVFQLGDLQARVMAVPGHTPACVAYAIGDAVFVGDTLFMPDVGTARCDFPGGNAHMLYRSVRKLLSLPAPTRLFMCHDYPPLVDGRPRAVTWESTVAQQREGNIHVHDGVSEEAFVKMRTARDAMLEMPTLIMPSVQVNIRAGELPPPEANGMRYLKIPLNAV